jgi:hypothetical protein
MKERWVEIGRPKTVAIRQAEYIIDQKGLKTEDQLLAYRALRVSYSGRVINQMLHSYLTEGIDGLYKTQPNLSLVQISNLQFLSAGLDRGPFAHEWQHAFGSSKSKPYTVSEADEAMGHAMIVTPTWSASVPAIYKLPGVSTKLLPSGKVEIVLSSTARQAIKESFNKRYQQELARLNNNGGPDTPFSLAYKINARNGLLERLRKVCPNPSDANITPQTIYIQATKFVFELKSAGLLSKGHWPLEEKTYRDMYISFAEKRLKVARNHEVLMPLETEFLGKVVGRLTFFAQRKFAQIPKPVLFDLYIRGLGTTLSIKALFPQRFSELQNMTGESFETEWAMQRATTAKFPENSSQFGAVMNGIDQVRKQLQ